MIPITHLLLNTEKEVAILRVLASIQLVHRDRVESYERRFAKVHLASLQFLTPLLWLLYFFQWTSFFLSDALSYRFLQLSPIFGEENLTKYIKALPYRNPSHNNFFSRICYTLDEILF